MAWILVVSAQQTLVITTITNQHQPLLGSQFSQGHKPGNNTMLRNNVWPSHPMTPTHINTLYSQPFVTTLRRVWFILINPPIIHPITRLYHLFNPTNISPAQLADWVATYSHQGMSLIYMLCTHLIQSKSSFFATCHTYFPNAALLHQ